MNNNDTTPASAPSHVSVFQWLLLLGFPPSVAAAKAMPEVFRADEALADEIVLPLFRAAA